MSELLDLLNNKEPGNIIPVAPKIPESGKVAPAPNLVPLQNNTPIAVQNSNAATQTTKPSFMNEEEYNDALQYYSPERIAEIYKGYDPKSVEPFYSTLYNNTTRKPDQLSDKQVKAARNIASLTDALKVLGEGITGLSGGIVNRDDRSAQNNVNSYIDNLRQLYKNEQDRYNSGAYNAALMDRQKSETDYNRDRQNLLDIINNSRRLRTQKDIADSKRNFEIEKMLRGEAGKDKDRESRDKHNKTMEKLTQQRNGIEATRAAAAATNAANGSTNKYDLLYDQNTGTTYNMPKGSINTMLPSIFRKFESKVFSNNPNEYSKYKSLSPSEQRDYALKHWMDDPEIVRAVDELSTGKKEIRKTVQQPSKTQKKGTFKIGW